MRYFDPGQHAHRRYNPLNGQWVLVSPHRTKRPWQGRVEKVARDVRPKYDPKCYLCPGNERANGERNPEYKATYAFPNDFAALLPDEVTVEQDNRPSARLFRTQPVKGECKVICFSPRHDVTLAQLPQEGIRKVIDCWAEESERLQAKYEWVQVFENKGEMMGCSNPHPHGQIWASDGINDTIKAEVLGQWWHYRTYKKPLLLDVAEAELDLEERVVDVNDSWLVIVPFWAVWPYETLLIPRFEAQYIHELKPKQRQQLAEILKRILCRYDNLFETSFPYTMGWHMAPKLREPLSQLAVAEEAWTLHAHLYPPLLRSATVRKFMVGYELLSEAQRDTTPEQAAARLRDCSTKPIA